jgi:hypothetical protein
MINYYIRPDGAIIKINGNDQTVINVVNNSNQKIISFITRNPDYYNKISADVISLNWSLSTQLDFDNNKTEVLNYLNELN